MRRARVRTILTRALLFVALLPVTLGILEAAVRLVADQPLLDVPGFFRADPDLVFGLDANVDFVWTTREFSYRVKTNAEGLREERDIGPKAPGEFRIVVAGDSTIFGHGVDDEGTLPRQLEHFLNEGPRPEGVSSYLVVNAGVMAYNPAQTARYVPLLIERYQPDLLVVTLSSAFSFRGLFRIPHDMRVEDGSVVPKKRTVVPAVTRLRNLLARHSQLYCYVASGLGPILVRFGIGDDAVSQSIAPPLDAIKDGYGLAREAIAWSWARGVPAVLLFVPDIYQANDERFETLARHLGDRFGDFDRDWVADCLRRLAGEDNILFIDPTLAILRDDHGRQSFFTIDMHPNAHGLGIMAASLAGALRKHGLLSFEGVREPRDVPRIENIGEGRLPGGTPAADGDR